MILALRLARYAPTWAVAEAAGLEFLGTEERERLGTFKAAARREQFVAARWMARQLLMEQRGGAPGDWELGAIAHTPPRLIRGPDPSLHVGLSHSGEWMACVVATSSVGIDLETVTRPRKVAPLARQSCSEEEQALLASLPPEQQLASFYRMWTQKEAWLKQRGLGIDFSLMRGLRVRDAMPGEPVNGLGYFDAEAGLRLALSSENLQRGQRMDAGGLAFSEEAWWLEQTAN
jgi:4'-phosphopantetheinyl transferase